MFQNKRWLAVLLASYSLSAFSHTWSIDFKVGAATAALNNQRNVYINHEILNTYVPHPGYTKFGPTFSVGAFYTLPSSPTLDVQWNVGLDYYLFKTLQGNGVDHPFSNAGNFDTLNYAYRLNSSALFLEPKLIYTHYAWQPYLVFGVGVAFNQATHFNEIPTNLSGPAAAPVYNFGNRSQQNLAGEVGVGVQHALATSRQTRLLVTLDYRYMNLGSSTFKPIPFQSNGQGFLISRASLQMINLGFRIQLGSY